MVIISLFVLRYHFPHWSAHTPSAPAPTTSGLDRGARTPRRGAAAIL